MSDLKRILDTTGIDTENSALMRDLHLDLKRMDHLRPEQMLSGVDAYRVRVLDSIKSPALGFYRFVFMIQYGNGDEGNFSPLGQEIQTETDKLPAFKPQ